MAPRLKDRYTSELRPALLGELGLTNVTVVPPGRDEPPDILGLGKESVPTFLFVGRLAANKRPDHAVEAFRIIKDELASARLWLVGTGPLEAELARTLPEDATLLGRVPRDELYARMAAALHAEIGAIDAEIKFTER